MRYVCMHFLILYMGLKSTHINTAYFIQCIKNTTVLHLFYLPLQSQNDVMKSIIYIGRRDVSYRLSCCSLNEVCLC